jgi:hypothetical protein
MICKKTPYPISLNRVKKSPLKTVAQTLKAKRDYKKGKSIGFTRRSSLKSMGLLPRADGCYKLGPKYI